MLFMFIFKMKIKKIKDAKNDKIKNCENSIKSRQVNFVSSQIQCGGALF